MKDKIYFSYAMFISVNCALYCLTLWNPPSSGLGGLYIVLEVYFGLFFVVLIFFGLTGPFLKIENQTYSIINFSFTIILSLRLN